ncbi:hypothetical protein VTO58DRAFT_106636 [Aureobasidium pullulans]
MEREPVHFSFIYEPITSSACRDLNRHRIYAPDINKRTHNVWCSIARPAPSSDFNSNRRPLKVLYFVGI